MKALVFTLVIPCCCFTAVMGCSTETVHFDGLAPERVQTAYEHIFHPPPPPPRERSSHRSGSGLRILDFDSFGTALGQAMAGLGRDLRSKGVWGTSSEQRWRKGRYKRTSSTWWLIFPVQLKSETATVRETQGGVEFRLEISPPNETLLKKRLGQVRANLAVQSERQRGPQ